MTQESVPVLNKQMWINSLKICLKIILAVCAAFFYMISVMFILAPNFDAKIFNFLGCKKAEESCLVQVYEKSDAITDLYNVVLIEQQLNNYEKELYNAKIY